MSSDLPASGSDQPRSPPRDAPTHTYLAPPLASGPDPSDATPHQTAATLEHKPSEGAPPPEPPRLPGRRLGEFLILREIGRGGMGIVFEAVQESLGRRVAIKVLRGTALMEETAIARFHREAETLARLRHPNIVPVYSVGEQDGTHYYAMELVAGLPLSRVIQLLRDDALGGTNPFDPGDYPTIDAQPARRPESAGPKAPAASPPPSRSRTLHRQFINTAVEMIAEVADALHHAHTHGVIHRDVKPGNMILAGRGKLMLLDFGLAHQAGLQALTHTGDFMGTPMYMSPEQTRAGKVAVDHRSDVYSLGVTLYELLTLQSPYWAEDTHALLQAILVQQPRRFRQVGARLPYDLEVILTKALEKDPDRRYQSAKELADDLRRFLNYEAIHARPPSLARRAGQFVRRHRGRFVIGAAAVTLTFGLVVVAATYSRRHQAAKVREFCDEGAALLDKARASPSPLEASRHFEEAAQQFGSALTLDPANEAAREGRLTVYRERCRSALQRKAYGDARGLVLLLKELDQDNAHAEEIAGFERQAVGRGTWQLDTDPPGCQVSLARLGDDFRTGPFLEVGTTPLPAREVDTGSYVARLSLPGYADVDCPLYVGRDEKATLKIPMILKKNVPLGMVYVPPGEFLLGDPGSATKVYVEGFFIDSTEVTGREYEEFVRQTKARPPDSWDDSRACPPPLRDCAVFNVSWFEAMDYARWAGKRLPREAEWEKAARGPDGRLYPWGNRFEPWRGNFRDSADRPTLRVADRKDGRSPYGCFDMAGNVWEWTLDPEKPHLSRRVIRGGAANSRADELFVYRRQSAPPGGSSFGGLNLLGFRCVKPLGKAAPPRPWLEELNSSEDLDAAAEFFWSRAEYGRVRECAKRLLGKNPRSVPGSYWAGILLHREKKYAESLSKMQTVYYQRRNFRTSKEFLQDLLMKLTNQGQMPSADWVKVPRLLQDARVALEKKDYAKAEPVLKKVLELDADNEVAHEELADVYRATGRPQQAAQHRQVRLRAYRAALAEDPDNAELLHDFAEFLVANEQGFKEALGLAEKAARLDPGSAAFQATLADVHFRLKNSPEALARIDKAIALDPESNAYRLQRQAYRGGRAK